jgi:hypothetical protein
MEAASLRLLYKIDLPEADLKSSIFNWQYSIIDKTGIYYGKCNKTTTGISAH